MGSGSDLAGQARRTALSARAVEILAFEHRQWKHAGAKEEAIRSQFGLSAARYYQLLNTVIDSPAAIVHDPMLVKRLQRLRDVRTRARSTRSPVAIGTGAIGTGSSPAAY